MKVPFFHVLTNICCILSFGWCYSNRCEVILTVILILISLIIINEHLSMFLLAISMSSLERYLLRSSFRFLSDCLFMFLVFYIELYEFFTCFGYYPFVRYIICKHLLSFSMLLFRFDGFLYCIHTWSHSLVSVVWCGLICLFLLLLTLLKETDPKYYC